MNLSEKSKTMFDYLAVLEELETEVSAMIELRNGIKTHLKKGNIGESCIRNMNEITKKYQELMNKCNSIDKNLKSYKEIKDTDEMVKLLAGIIIHGYGNCEYVIEEMYTNLFTGKRSFKKQLQDIASSGR